MITDEMVQEACDIYSGVYVDDDKDMGDAMRAVLSHFHDRIEALEAELKLTKEQRNEGGEMILKLVARIYGKKGCICPRSPQKDRIMMLEKRIEKLECSAARAPKQDK